MKTKIVLPALLLLVPSLALAVGFEIVPAADCDGWSTEVQVRFGTTDRNLMLDYTVTLTDVATGMVVDEQTGSEALGFVSGETVVYTYSGTWPELCGKYAARGMFVLSGDGVSNQRSFSFSFVCDCDEPDGCFRTPGYWKTHPEDPAWPDDGFAIGGVHYSNAELIAIMETPVGGDATIILAHHLVAAKLNVLAGEDGIAEYDDAIADGDDLLATYPLYSKPTGGAKHEVLDVKDILEGYNELGCGEEEEYPEDQMMLLDKAADEETTTWGDLKSRFR